MGLQGAQDVGLSHACLKLHLELPLAGGFQETAMPCAHAAEVFAVAFLSIPLRAGGFTAMQSAEGRSQHHLKPQSFAQIQAEFHILSAHSVVGGETQLLEMLTPQQHQGASDGGHRPGWAEHGGVV